MTYEHKDIDRKWQQRWEEARVFHAEDHSDKDPFYCLVEFPYPSGIGLHIGHPRSYTALDVLARKRRMQGQNVLYPIGWDAFGLPTENYAIKTGRKPQDVTKENVDRFREQLKSLGIGFDWEREVNTTDPGYYKWTQWMFQEFFKAGLAYKEKMAINWCVSCKIGLANEEVVAGACERCGGEVEKRDKEQWMIAITKYADRLLEDLETVDYLPKIKKQQQDWIGKSVGAEVDFRVDIGEEVLVSTGNASKLERNQFCVARANAEVKLVTPEDKGLERIEVEEGSDIVENARAKALAYVEQAQMPVHGMDSGFYIAGEELDPALVRRNALEGRDESAMTQEEIRDVMLAYYQGIVEKHGGQVSAYWRDVFVLVTPDGREFVSEGRRDVMLGTEPHGEVDAYFPIRSLYTYTSNGKYTSEMNDDERFDVLAPYTEALLAVLQPTLRVFTTRPDTLFGATYMVLAPEHEMTKGLATSDRQSDVEAYISAAAKKSDIDRGDATKEKTGVFTGSYAVNPVNGKRVPIWTADYVLTGYGTGAIMAVPAHDERDFAFAQKFELEIIQVIQGPQIQMPADTATQAAGAMTQLEDVGPQCWTGDGTLINSDFLNGKSVDEAKESIIAWLEEKGAGEAAVNYRLRDWVFSRQRYWGEPIPLVKCASGCSAETDHWITVPEEQLPVQLPVVENYQPTDTGESPLAAIEEWVNTTCPECDGPAKRETDTMPNWAGSSWYFLRYIDPHNDEKFADPEKLAYWMPVNWYNGGMEHTTLHLLYSRFWNKFLHDRGHVPSAEPYAKRTSHGLILAADGTKMSKSKGNGVDPLEIVDQYGADTLRVYELFIGPFSEPVPWSMNSMIGVRRFLDKVMRLPQLVQDAEPEAVTRALHKTIKKVSDDIEAMRYNTAVAAMMSCVNEMMSAKAVTKETLVTFLHVLGPFAPHVCNELAEQLGVEELLEVRAWPEYDEAMLVEDEVTIAIQVNGKLRGSIQVAADADKESVLAAARAETNVAKYLEDGVKKEILVPGKLVNFVV